MAHKSTPDVAFSEIDSIGDTSAVLHAIAGGKPRRTHCHQHTANCKHRSGGGAQGFGEAEIDSSVVEKSFLERFRYFLIALPFIVLFSFKEALDHTDGIWTTVCLAISFFYTNQRVKNAACRFEPAWCALAASSVVLTGLVGLHYVFREEGVYFSLICVPNRISSANWLSLFLSIVIVDFSLKHITILAKSVVIFLSPKVISISSRSTILIWMEFVSQVYRTIPPMVSWTRYLLDLGVSPKKHSMFAIIFFFIVYALLKLISLWFTVYPMWPIFSKLTFDVPYSTRFDLPSSENEVCNLCLENKGNIVAALNCGHAFCKPCLDRWLIYYSECPVCSQSLGSEFKDWRDGSTSMAVQFF